MTVDERISNQTEGEGGDLIKFVRFHKTAINSMIETMLKNRFSIDSQPNAASAKSIADDITNRVQDYCLTVLENDLEFDEDGVDIIESTNN